MAEAVINLSDGSRGANWAVYLTRRFIELRLLILVLCRVSAWRIGQAYRPDAPLFEHRYSRAAFRAPLFSHRFSSTKKAEAMTIM